LDLGELGIRNGHSAGIFQDLELQDEPVDQSESDQSRNVDVLFCLAARVWISSHDQIGESWINLFPYRFSQWVGGNLAMAILEAPGALACARHPQTYGLGVQ